MSCEFTSGVGYTVMISMKVNRPSWRSEAVSTMILLSGPPLLPTLSQCDAKAGTGPASARTRMSSRAPATRHIGLVIFTILSAVLQAQALPGAIGRPAAVYGDGLTVDEAAHGGVRQEAHGICDVLGRGEAAHRDPVRDIRIGVTAACLVCHVHLGFDPAGANRVATHAVAAPLGGE